MAILLPTLFQNINSKKMKPFNIKYLYLIPVLVLIVSCSKDDIDLPEQNGYISYGEAVSSGSVFDVEFCTEDSLFVGYNKVYFKVTDKSSGNSIDQATINLHPVMDMGTFRHGCPTENPDEVTGSDGYFEGAVLFSMPGYNNSWSLSIDISANGKTDTAFFTIPKVVPTNPVKKIVAIDSLSTGPGTWKITKHPVSLIEPDSWKTGNNRFEITIHTMASMWSFPCCNNLTVEIEPEMPSMGHGSPNNVNPVLTENGHYVGTVNFTMTGTWRVNLTIREGDRVIGKGYYFDIIF